MTAARQGDGGHVPVLLRETVEGLVGNEQGTYLDCTFGGGGHARAILARLGPAGRLLALDWDAEASARAAPLAAADSRFAFERANFSAADEALERNGFGRADGALFDLGVSMFQFAAAERGFSFTRDGPIDMRMDGCVRRTAADAVNRLPEKRLESVLAEFGGVRQARKIARHLVRRRRARPFATTRDLADTVAAAVARRGKTHPATQVFQALRICVNDELENLRAGLAAAARCVCAGGRLAVISFHSAEDRIVKDFIRGAGGQAAPFRRLGGLVRPAREEVLANPRARSARLRLGVRVRGDE